jgi:hypothetical protein
MRRVLLLVAAAVLLVANGWGIWQATKNRPEPRGGTLDLTERELPLQPMALESSVTVLRLNWSTSGRTDRRGDDRQGPPAWLDTNKLAELGFDCSLPLTDPKAPRHYASTPPRPVFLLLEYRASVSERASEPARAATGLIVVDAALDPDRLRQRYPDPQKHAICRGLVRITLSHHNSQNSPPEQLYLQGWIQGLSPSEVSVPVPENRLLTRLPRPEFEDVGKPPKPPRFSARVRWGKNYEPWVDEVRPIESPR